MYISTLNGKMTINEKKINKSILIFFKFVYLCLFLYSRCYLYPWASILMFHSTQLLTIPTVWISVKFVTQLLLYFSDDNNLHIWPCSRGNWFDTRASVFLAVFVRNNEMFQKQVNDKLTSICFCFLLCSSISSLVVLLNLSCSPWSSVSMFLRAFSASTS